ncbi:class I SAM-dependent methyltransferase [Rhodoferax sediminis]|jgi:SAM-dependent methyltransferase|uniref:Methyltransferase domain-containing protein n=1 Tax=Rhodoferax sediminis TaxID=2509614 RepID=A0A515D701_9BURK|nr:class I SAM-dependent methyltransferase [Rhodoferax sediminis]QDL36184.1 methyltransferase domain-containing protein [Rhodoferax sediminis]
MQAVHEAGPGLAAVHAAIARYYTDMVQTHGATPHGVDWTCVPTQELRFVQLLKLCDFTVPFSLNDLGCGYGALLAFLAKRHRGSKVDYLGVDLSSAMVAQARELWAKRRRTEFVVGHASPRSADYSLASGIFNVRLDQSAARWTRFIASTLERLHATSRRGFAVNFMAPLPRGVTGTSELYRAPLGLWRRYCEQTLGAKVEVITGYGMREYTLLVRPI